MNVWNVHLKSQLIMWLQAQIACYHKHFFKILKELIPCWKIKFQ